MNRYTALTLAMLALSLSACNSSNDGTNNTSSTITGKAADGYLKNAKVCLDANQNFKCDAGEVSAITAANGSYELNASADALNRYPLLLEATAGKTSDADLVTASNPNGLVADDFILYAPPRSSFISPFTSLQYELMQQNPQLSAQAAAEYVQAQFDLSLAVGQDYIAAQNSDAHDKAQKIIQNLKNAYTSITATESGQAFAAERSKADFQRLIFSGLLQNSDKITQQTLNAAANFSLAELKLIQSAQALTVYKGEVDPDSILSTGLAQPIISAFGTPITFSGLNDEIQNFLNGGSIDISGLGNGVPAENARYQTGLAFEALRLVDGEIQQKRTLVGASDVISTTISPYYGIDWNGTSWQVVDYAKPLGFKIPTRSSCNILSCLLTMTEYDLSDQAVMPTLSQVFLALGEQAVDPERFATQYQLTQAVFAKGAKAYKVSFKPQLDALELNCELTSNDAASASCLLAKNLDGVSLNSLDQISDQVLNYNGIVDREIEFSLGNTSNSGSYKVFDVTKKYSNNIGCYYFGDTFCTPQITRTLIQDGTWQRSTF